MREYTIELEIYRGKGGQPRADGTHLDLAKEGICAWMYGSYEQGHTFRCPNDLGILCPWLVDSLTGSSARSRTAERYPGSTAGPRTRRPSILTR